MKIKRRSQSPLKKKSNRGFRGYPVATIAFYGPDDSHATKVAVGIVSRENGEPVGKRSWRSIKEHAARSVVMTDRIIGCPHEEGIDYPEGEICPCCPFWAGRDRWTGEYRH